MTFGDNPISRLVEEHDFNEVPLIPIKDLKYRRTGQLIKVRGQLQATKCYDARWYIYKTDLLFHLIIDDSTGQVLVKWSCKAGPELANMNFTTGQMVNVYGVWKKLDNEQYIDATSNRGLVKMHNEI